MLQSRWASASMPAPEPLAQALHAARLIGAEAELVLHGGGNTSVKLERDGRQVLYVKGSGAGIPIEERAAAEVAGFGAMRWAPAGVAVANPAFDVTPARLVDALITERGVINQPNRARLREFLAT